MKIKDGFVVRKIGESYYAVPVRNYDIKNGMIKLNETAHFIWTHLEMGMDVEEIADAMCAEYNAERERVVSDIKIMVERLGKVGVLEGTDEA